MRRVGVYVDASNIGMNGGHGMRFDVLRGLACRANGEAQRLNVYLAFDEQRAEVEPEYGAKARAYQNALRDQGFRVTVKIVKRFRDEDGVVTLKSNTDLDMAVDVLTESQRLDTVLLATGDGDFIQVVRALQSKGCRVEVLGFDNVASELRDGADQFINGYLVPSLLSPKDVAESTARWGQLGSRVRGFCKQFDAAGGYGFLNYWPNLPTSVIAATEFQQAYFKAAHLTDRQIATKLPSRSIVLEFDLTEPAKREGVFEARRIQVVGAS